MRRNIYPSRIAQWLCAASVAVATCIATEASAQDKPDTPVNLKADASYSLVTLSWQRSATAADTLLSEGFEGATFPPDGWTLKTTNENDPSYTWFGFPTEEIIDYIDDYTSYIHSGERSAFVNIDMGAPYDDGTPGEQDEWLITPAVEGAVYLDFQSKLPSALQENAEYEDFPNHYYVKVSHDGGQTWETLWDGTHECDFTDQWQPVSLYLGDPSAGATMVAFHATSGSDDPDVSLFATWAIDDVRLTNGTASSAAMENFNVYYDGEPIAEGLKALTFTDNTEKEAGEHTYAVRSCNSALEELSDPAEVTVNIKEATTNAPTNVKVTYTYDEETNKYDVLMTWDAPEGERTPAYYTAYCNNATFGDYIEENNVGQTGLSKGIYEYSVVAVYQYPDGESEAVGDQLALGTRFPARDLTATRNDDGSLSLSWEAPKESEYAVSGYKVFRGNIKLAEQEGTSFTETESVEGCYDYSVKAIYADSFEATPATVAVENGDMPAYELPFSEDFTGGLKPGNWTVTKNRSGLKDNYLWRFDNWYDLPVSGNGFDADFASANSSSAGLTTVNTSIYTPQLVRNSIADNESTYLEFDMDYMTGGKSFAYVAYSTDNGNNWTDLVQELTGYTADDLSEGETCKPQHMSIDVTNLFANGNKVQFAWIYNGKSAQHLAIDNVNVFNADPTAINSITTAKPHYTIENSTLRLNADGISRVKLYKADGTLVADTEATDIPLSGHGLYIVNAKTANGSFTIKLSVK